MKAAKAASGPVLQSSFIKLLLVPLLTLWIDVSLGIRRQGPRAHDHRAVQLAAVHAVRLHHGEAARQRPSSRG
ncbi:hypothetical protein AQ610_15425 [Burkholderia humptydooensis]|uniref:Secreted protein n=1 Tax=Burkholderia humptydooensis MSMB43 TaxID=441157 RepID=A0ABN0GCM4_9BURK|nr:MULTISPECIES: hypothetical protein [Burkholderia]ALX43655.1 hypothetical protein AQ610_15425 [Burkholderia humptydooensis]EIP90031.1 hypothetical protein A33K_13615 [Burkholderia humptydooensis MSMB43]